VYKADGSPTRFNVRAYESHIRRKMGGIEPSLRVVVVTHNWRLMKKKVKPIDQSENLWLVAMSKQNEADRRCVVICQSSPSEHCKLQPFSIFLLRPMRRTRRRLLLLPLEIATLTRRRRLIDTITNSSMSMTMLGGTSAAWST
jgi:hypothetical protein